ncbi:MAG TPA: hypothetical protein V6C58_02405 [Allocoleopsis sp.]
MAISSETVMLIIVAISIAVFGASLFGISKSENDKCSSEFISSTVFATASGAVISVILVLLFLNNAKMCSQSFQNLLG